MAHHQAKQEETIAEKVHENGEIGKRESRQRKYKKEEREREEKYTTMGERESEP